jgi:prevent-host-death family protein
MSINSDNLILMKRVAITVTEAARNFAECVNRARYQNMSFVLLKNGKPVARLVPETDRICTGRDLAEAMGKAELSAEEARAWRKDLVAARTKLTVPRDKWQ